MKKIVKILPSAAILLPLVALAQSPDLGWFDRAVTEIGDLVDRAIPVVIAIGLLFFIWGIVQYIAASGDEAAKEEGKRKMIWGIVALFVIIAVWGLVQLLFTLTGVSTTASFSAPGIPA